MPRQPNKIEFEINENGCFICTSHARTNKGYPRIKLNQVDLVMHRFIYEECFGEIPEGLLIRHKCDNRACINPEHLETGTHQDNMDDKVARGRCASVSNKGEDAGRAILTEEDVLNIRSDSHSTNKSLGKLYSVHHATISAVRLRKIWTHI